MIKSIFKATAILIACIAGFALFIWVNLLTDFLVIAWIVMLGLLAMTWFIIFEKVEDKRLSKKYRADIIVGDTNIDPEQLRRSIANLENRFNNDHGKSR